MSKSRLYVLGLFTLGTFAMGGAQCGGTSGGICDPTDPGFNPLTGRCNDSLGALPGTGGLPAEPGTNPPPGAGDGVGDGDVDLDVYGLNGKWLDNSNARETCIVDDGTSVSGHYIDPYFCEHLDGSGAVSNTMVNFEATKTSGFRVEGTTNACYFGENNPHGTGIKSETMVLEISSDGKTLSGTYHSDFDGADLPLTFTRLTVGNCAG